MARRIGGKEEEEKEENEAGGDDKNGGVDGSGPAEEENGKDNNFVNCSFFMERDANNESHIKDVDQERAKQEGGGGN